MTLDMRRVNKAIRSTNLPIPRPELISSKLAGYQLFTKLDLSSAFHQLELEQQSRFLTVFHAGDRLMRYRRLIMGCSPASGELNKALQPMFKKTEHVYIIQDDIIVAGKTKREHDRALHDACEILLESGLTLNASKCIVEASTIPWW